MKFLVLCLFPLTLISRVFKTQAVFTNNIEGRDRNPAFPEQVYVVTGFRTQGADSLWRLSPR